MRHFAAWKSGLMRFVPVTHGWEHNVGNAACV